MDRLKLGLTMKIASNLRDFELRDSLAHDWHIFLQYALPRANWLPMPNLGKKIKDYIQKWGLNGFIFTGGDDLFKWPQRDETEITILKYAMDMHLPVFGVCRGMQIIAHYFGHHVVPCPQACHAGTEHTVKLMNYPFKWKEKTLLVNSYHNNCLGSANHFSGPLIPFAMDLKGLTEGIFHRNELLFAVMWHPERNRPISDFDIKLVRTLFWNRGESF